MILVTGCPRSGTSILGELFDYHPDVKYYFEMENIQIHPHKPTAVKHPAAALQLNRLYNELGDALKVIYIIRDPRDAVCSLMPGLKDGWGHRPNERIIAACKDKPLVEKCALFWREHVYTALEAITDKAFYMIKYEQFLANPKIYSATILQYCGLSWHSKIDRYVDIVGNDTIRHRYAKGSKHWGDNGHQIRIGRYKNELTRKEIETVEIICSKLMDRFDYAQD